VRRILAVSTVVASMLSVAGVRAAVPSAPVVPQNRSTEPVVLTGRQFPSWSGGPDPAAHEPQIPTNYDTADVQQYLPQPARSACYQKPSDTGTSHADPYDYSDNGDHNCYQPSRLPRNPRAGADVNLLLGYAWNGHHFVQIPFQIDQVFTRYITNNDSGFAFYSGVDQETTYAFDREGFRYSSDDWLQHGGNPCTPEPAADASGGHPATTPDPLKGLHDDDQLVFMYSDAGAQAPSGQKLPNGIASAYDVRVADPTSPATVRHVYVMLSKGGHGDPRPAFTAANGYVRYLRDAGVADPANPGRWLVPPADMFVYSQSSYSGYGAAPKGPYCNLDGTIATGNQGDKPDHGITIDPGPNQKPWDIEQRRPLDTAWVKTDRYEFRYDGRWLMTALRVSPSGRGLTLNDYGPDLVDQWKARAFQQRPGGTTPCCGYEEEVNNWGGSSILFGERVGPVRAIRAAWGADSSTNNIKTEIFYRDEIRFQDALRVHVIPPADGIYVQWDHNAGAITRYYNPWTPANGVAVDGRNDEVFGNDNVHIANDRVQVTDPDPIPVVGPQDQTVPLVPGADPNDCSIGKDPLSENGICNDIDLADPTFSGPVGTLNWEEVAGPYGTLVTRWTIGQHTAGDAYSLIAQPYYRDDSCFDDGTGGDPGPHLHKRGVDDGSNGTYVDPRDGLTKPRVCWTPADGDPNDTSIGDGRPRKFWQGDIGTHGLHIQLIADSDNAQVAFPLDEVDSEQRMVVLPGDKGNVGEMYGRGVEYPLEPVAVPYTG